MPARRHRSRQAVEPAGACRPDDVAAGLSRLDGYLYWHARLAEARRDAEHTADLLPWLTAAQRADLVDALTTAHTERARGMVRLVADRIAEVRGEYEDRYRALRIRLVGWAAAALGAAVAAGAALALMRG